MAGKKKPTISSHVLDLETGMPAAGFRIVLSRIAEGKAQVLCDAETDADGRIADLLQRPLETGIYRVTFDVTGYMEKEGREAPFMHQVDLTVNVADAGRHYHVPLLVTRYACSSYRGS